MKQFKKTISLFLALVMCLGMVNISVFADESIPDADVSGTAGNTVETGTSEDGTPVGDETPAEEGTSEDGTPAEDGTSEDGTPAEDGTSEDGTPVGDGTSEDGIPVGDGTSEEGTPAEDGTSEERTPVEDGTSEEGTPVETDPVEETPEAVQAFLDAVAELPEEINADNLESANTLIGAARDLYDALGEELWTRQDVADALAAVEAAEAKAAEAAKPAPGDVTDEAGLVAAFASDQATITLGESFTVNDTIAVTREVTLDLNGQTLTWDNANANNISLFQVAQGSKLTITDSTDTVGYTKDYTVMTSTVNTDRITTTETTETRTATAMGGKITIKNEIFTGFDENLSAIITVSGGELVMENGVIDGAGADGRRFVRGVLVTDSGSVAMNGGAIVHCAARSYGTPYGSGIFVRDGSLVMTGGILADNGACGFYDIYRRGGGIGLRDGSLAICGGVIAGNETGVGGGIVAENGAGTIDISGGVIAGNIASVSYCNGGGGVDVNGGYTVTVSDSALITGNTTTSFGGGISAQGGAELVVSGGQITGNSAHSGGGAYSGNDFTMTGGIIAGNIARGNTEGDDRGDGEGGGLRINGGTAEITGGYITNNETRTTVDWGGGGVFVSMWAKIQFKNLLVTGNEAQGLGGGVGGCSTGKVAISATDGLASFGNTAYGHKENGAHAAHKWQDQAALKNDDFLYYGSNDFFCAHNSYVTDAMMGGGSANWHGSKDTGEGYRGNSAENGWIDVQQLAIPQGGADAAESLMGLSAAPSEEDQGKAMKAAHVFITGNKSSTHGGGIMCNGTMFAGTIDGNAETKFSSVSVEAAKTYQNADGTAISMAGGEFTFALVKETDFSIVDGKPSYTNAQTAVNDANGKVLFTINGLTEVGTYIYYLVEEPGTGLITYDPAIYKVTVEVTEVTEITWEIDTKLTATVYNGSVKSIVPVTVDEDGTLVAADAVENATFTNTYSGELTVNKVWVGDSNEGARPGSVQVQLYKNGKPVNNPVRLMAEDGWTYTWTTGLDKDAVYTVEELNVPEGYAASTSQTGDVVTITNTLVTGSLTISKEVKGLTGDELSKAHTFIFTVEAKDAEVKALLANKTIDGVKFNPDGVTFNADGVATVKIEVTGNGSESVTLTGLPIGAYLYSVTEDVNSANIGSDWEVSISGQTSEIKLSSSGTVTVTNTYTPHHSGGTDPTYTSLTVKKEWKGDNEEIRPESISVQLLRNGRAEGDPVELNARNGWEYTWHNLSANQTWTVAEVDVPEGYTSRTSTSGTTVTITNTYNSETEIPENPTPQSSTLSVNKVWAGDTEANRPESVSVQILKDGEVQETVTLNSDNGWSWSRVLTEEELASKWTVSEVEVPAGYTSVVTTGDDGISFTVTNTFTDEDIPEEDTPTTDTPTTDVPEVQPPLVEVPDVQPPLVVWPDPSWPDTVWVTPEPEVTVPEEQPPLAEIPGEDVPTTEIPDGDVPMTGVPQTGDISLAWYVVAIVSAMGLAVLTLKKREGEED